MTIVLKEMTMQDLFEHLMAELARRSGHQPTQEALEAGKLYARYVWDLGPAVEDQHTQPLTIELAAQLSEKSVGGEVTLKCGFAPYVEPEGQASVLKFEGHDLRDRPSGFSEFSLECILIKWSNKIKWSHDHHAFYDPRLNHA